MSLWLAPLIECGRCRLQLHPRSLTRHLVVADVAITSKDIISEVEVSSNFFF
jgi:hypothetical protein